jgi:hypothetical protein
MKAKEITLNLTRNLGNYETARMAVTYEINEGDDVIDSFKSAQLEINEAFDALFPDYNAGSFVEKSDENYSFKSAQLEINEAFDALFPDYNAGSYVEKSVESNYDNETTIKKQQLMIDDEKFLKIKKRIMNGTLTIEDVEKYYELGEREHEVLTTIEKLKEL